MRSELAPFDLTGTRLAPFWASSLGASGTPFRFIWQLLDCLLGSVRITCEAPGLPELPVCLLSAPCGLWLTSLELHKPPFWTPRRAFDVISELSWEQFWLFSRPALHNLALYSQKYFVTEIPNGVSVCFLSCISSNVTITTYLV